MKRPIDTMIERANAKRLKIAVVGDCMTDVYGHGQLGECQEDCYKFVEESRVSVPGGAANAARSLENWNVTCECFGNTQKNGPVKTRFVVNGKYIFRHDLDEMSINDRQRSMEFAALRNWGPDAILLSDYDKGFLTPEFIRQVIDYANERKIPVISDVKRSPELYRGAILKCNESYRQKFWNQLREYPNTFFVTHGQDRPFWYLVPKGQIECGKPLPPVECRNNVGAGDAFAAHLTLALAHGMSLHDSASVAHSAGRCYVQKMHNEPPTVDDIRKDMGDA